MLYEVITTFELDGRKMAVTICEDIWNDAGYWQRPLYEVDPLEELGRAGIHAILNLSASPFTQGKHAVRENMLAAIAGKYGVPVLYANHRITSYNVCYTKLLRRLAAR